MSATKTGHRIGLDSIDTVTSRSLAHLDFFIDVLDGEEFRALVGAG